MHHEARKIPRPAVLTALALLFGAATSVANAQSFVYAGTSSPSDPYAYLNDLSMPHGVTVNMGALDQIGKDGLKMPDGHYPTSRGPQGAQGAEGGDAPVSQAFLPGRSGGHSVAPPPRKAAPQKAVQAKPATAKPAAARPQKAEKPAAVRPVAVSKRGEDLPPSEGLTRSAPSPRPAPPPPSPVEPVPAPQPVAVAPRKAAEPVVAKPAEPVMAKPVEPVMAKPAEPVAVKPVEPVVAKPAEPVMAKPAEPVVAKPAEPVVAKPAEPVMAKAEPVVKPPPQPTKERVTLVSPSQIVRPSAPVSLVGPTDEVPSTVAVAPSKPPATSQRIALSTGGVPIRTEEPAPAAPPRAASAPAAQTAPQAAPPTPAVKPAPQAAAPAASPAAPPPQQLAARTAPAQADGGMAIRFASGTADLPASAAGELDAVVRSLTDDPTRRVVLQAYATADASGGANRAKRLSLTRALNVRAYLMDKGVRSPSIEVRAMGDQGGGTADRVDIRVTP